MKTSDNKHELQEWSVPAERVPLIAAMDLEPQHTGWLVKKRLKSFMGLSERRWCCIKDGVFYYYKTKESKRQQDSFCLKGYEAEEILSRDMSTGKKSLWFRMVKLGGRTYQFQAIDELVLQGWICAIAQASSGDEPEDIYTDIDIEEEKDLLMVSAIRHPAAPPARHSSRQRSLLKKDVYYDDTELDFDWYDDVTSGPLDAVRPDHVTTGPPLVAAVRAGHVTTGPPVPTVRPDPKHSKLHSNRVGVVGGGGGGGNDSDSGDSYQDVMDSKKNSVYYHPDDGASDESEEEYDDTDLTSNSPSHGFNVVNTVVKQSSSSSQDEGFHSEASNKSNHSKISSAAQGRKIGVPLPPIPQEANPIILQQRTQPMPQLTPAPFNPNSNFYNRLYLATHDFQGKLSDELSFRKGDLIKVISKRYDGQQWWTGNIDKRAGLVPKTHLVKAYQPQ